MTETRKVRWMDLEDPGLFLCDTCIHFHVELERDPGSATEEYSEYSVWCDRDVAELDTWAVTGCPHFEGKKGKDPQGTEEAES